MLRRLFAGLLSMLCGHGGDTCAAAWLGLHPKTVRRGRRELASGKFEPQRVRKRFESDVVGGVGSD